MTLTGHLWCVFFSVVELEDISFFQRNRFRFLCCDFNVKPEPWSTSTWCHLTAAACRKLLYSLQPLASTNVLVFFHHKSTTWHFMFFSRCLSKLVGCFCYKVLVKVTHFTSTVSTALNTFDTELLECDWLIRRLHWRAGSQPGTAR